MSITNDHLAALSRVKLFSVLDLSSSYLQIPLDAESRPKTAFVASTETGEFTRTPFGLPSGPADFSRIMYKALGTLKNHSIFNYSDDILVTPENKK